MKDLIAIKIQSHTDLITNSSSELFQLKTDSTVEQIKETLEGITYGYMEPIYFDIDEYYKYKDKFKQLVNSFPKDKSFDEKWDYKQKLIKMYPKYYIYDTIQNWFLDRMNVDDVIYTYKSYLIGNYKPLDKYQIEFYKYILEDDYEEDDDYRIDLYDISDGLILDYIISHTVPYINDIWQWSIYYGIVEDLDKCIIVLSKDENSIPFDTWDTINEMFNGTNYHLG